MDKPSPEMMALYRELVAEVVTATGAKDSTMFGMPTLKTAAGKAFAGVTWNGMVFKLTDAEVRAEALALTGATNFDPSGTRPMREWVVLGVEHAERFTELALAAHAGVV